MPEQLAATGDTLRPGGLQDRLVVVAVRDGVGMDPVPSHLKQDLVIIIIIIIGLNFTVINNI